MTTGPRRITYHAARGYGYTDITALAHHGGEDDPVSVVGQVGITHTNPENDQSWHNYSGSEVTTRLVEPPRVGHAPERRTTVTDTYSREIDHGDAFSMALGASAANRYPQMGEDRPLFVSRGGEGDPRKSQVSFLRASKGSRALVPSMLGMAQFEAASRGHVLEPDASLSKHSARIVGKLQQAGVAGGTPASVSNDLDFQRETTYPDYYDWAQGEPNERKLSLHDVNRGRRAGREMVRQLRQPPKVEQPALFDAGDRALQSANPMSRFHRTYQDSQGRDRVILGGHLRKLARPED